MLSWWWRPSGGGYLFLALLENEAMEDSNFGETSNFGVGRDLRNDANRCVAGVLGVRRCREAAQLGPCVGSAVQRADRDDVDQSLSNCLVVRW